MKEHAWRAFPVRYPQLCWLSRRLWYLAGIRCSISVVHWNGRSCFCCPSWQRVCFHVFNIYIVSPSVTEKSTVGRETRQIFCSQSSKRTGRLQAFWHYRFSSALGRLRGFGSRDDSIFNVLPQRYPSFSEAHNSDDDDNNNKNISENVPRSVINWPFMTYPLTSGAILRRSLVSLSLIFKL